MLNSSGQSNSCRIIYFAGGCFWGIEKLMQSLPGVKRATSGYANGTGIKDAVYETVCRGRTGFRETVKVEYDVRKITLKALLFAYFSVIDATQINQQGPDRGTQYQTGIYYEEGDEDSKAVIEQIAAVEAEGIRGPLCYFSVEIKPLSNFFPAEEYHQNYLSKNPSGYCHIPLQRITQLSRLPLTEIEYTRPAREILHSML